MPVKLRCIPSCSCWPLAVLSLGDTRRLPWLDRILVTPQVHRIHHSIDAVHHNRNFADALPIFDIVFGNVSSAGAGGISGHRLGSMSIRRRAPSGWHSLDRCAIGALFAEKKRRKTGRSPAIDRCCRRKNETAGRDCGFHFFVIKPRRNGAPRLFRFRASANTSARSGRASSGDRRRRSTRPAPVHRQQRQQHRAQPPPQLRARRALLVESAQADAGVHHAGSGDRQRKEERVIQHADQRQRARRQQLRRLARRRMLEIVRHQESRA